MTVYDQRRDNLRTLVEHRGSLSALSRALGYKNPSFFSQMTCAKPTRDVTEATARKIEEVLGLPPGSMDHPGMPMPTKLVVPAPAVRIVDAPAAPTTTASHIAPYDPDTSQLVTEVIRLVGNSSQDLGVELSTARLLRLVEMAWADTAEHGAPRPEHIKQLVSLLAD